MHTQTFNSACLPRWRSSVCIKGFGWTTNVSAGFAASWNWNCGLSYGDESSGEKSVSLAMTGASHAVWFVDFTHDQLTDDRTFQLFNMLDDFSRKGIGIKTDFPLPAMCVKRAMDQLSHGG
jgi:putative transposase